MPNEILWKPQTVASLLTTELNNQVKATTVVDGADYDNATNKYRWADFFFFGTFDAACVAGDNAELHIFYKFDGTHYGDNEDGDVAAVAPAGNTLHGLFVIGAQADVYSQILGVPLRPFAFRVGLKLATTQDLTAVDTHWVKMYPYNEEMQ